jgi:aryl sulfotransferase
MSTATALDETGVPVKSGELLNHLMDSTRWNNFPFRDDDIVIATWAKSGTTWVQQIVGQLIFNGAEGIPVTDLAPWVDMRVMPFEELLAQVEAQEHRRFLKTHLPADALKFSPNAKYIYIARDGRDVAWSLYNHLCRMTPDFYAAINEIAQEQTEELSAPDVDVKTFFHGWIERDGFPMDSFWRSIQSWWNVRNSPNVLLLHYANMKADMEREIRRIAEFLEIEIDEAKWPVIVEHCTFDYMKKNADTLSDHFAPMFEGGLKNFVYKGTNGRWRDELNADDIAKYEKAAAENLTAACKHWLETGNIPAD